MYLNFQKMITQFNIKPGHSLIIDTMTTGLQMTVQGLGLQLISAGILCSLTEAERKKLDYCLLPDFPVTRKCCVVWREDTDQMPLIREAIKLLRESVLPQMIYTEVISNGS